MIKKDTFRTHLKEELIRIIGRLNRSTDKREEIRMVSF
jgi:hypothetical protein